MTIYPSSYINDVDFLSMDMTNRSYRYYTGEPLFPFGFGLSYTSFSLKWSHSVVPTPTLFQDLAGSTKYSVLVTNTGKIVGDEVVQAFLKPERSSLATLGVGTPVPLKQLFGFQRVTLKPGESKTLDFTLTAEQLAMVDLDGHTSLHAGDFNVIFSRGHSEELVAQLRVAVAQPIRLKTFRRWW